MMQQRPHSSGVDIDTRGNEAVLWLAVELLYIDSPNAQTRRCVNTRI